MTPEGAAKASLEAVVNEAHDLISSSGRPVGEFLSTAFYSTERDDHIRGLPSFAPARKSIRALPEVGRHFPADETDRLVLQFVYNTIRRSDFSRDPAAAFQGTWEDFRDEAAAPDWIFRGVANLEFLNIETSGDGSFEEFSGPQASGMIRLADDVLIVGRSDDALAPLGVTPSVMQRLREEWGGFGSSPFVMVVESRQPKSPDNLVLSGDGQATVLANRVLLAMRLLAPGHVGIGSMHLLRPARFDVGIGGSVRSVPPPSSVLGQAFELRPSLLPAIQQIEGQLAALSQPQPFAGPPRLLLALRYFGASYDRSVQSDAVVDLVTCLEAVLGTDVEITYKLPMRVAQLLASDDDERVQTFQDVKRWYGLRSKLVHGGELKARDQVLLSDPEPLRETVRRLLVGFLKLAVDNSPAYGANFFETQLDVTLLSTSEAAKLRTAMGLHDGGDAATL